jgi:carbon storage regulator
LLKQWQERNMLVLSRKTNESIVIGENIVVTVVAIQRNQIRLGIDAPQKMAVHRREIYEAIKRGEVPKEGNATCEK